MSSLPTGRSATPMTITRARLQVREIVYRSSRVVVSPGMQKLVLLIVAAVERQRVTTAQLAALAGISYQTCQNVLTVLHDQGLIVRVDVPKGTRGLAEPPKNGPTYAYRLDWAAVARLPVADVASARKPVGGGS